MSGMGTTSAFVGAYVLAGEISKHSDDLPKAFAEYDRVLRPFVNELQKDVKKMRWIFRRTWTGVWIFNLLLRILWFLGIPSLIARLMPEEKGGWVLPEYPKLHSGTSSSY